MDDIQKSQPLVVAVTDPAGGDGCVFRLDDYRIRAGDGGEFMDWPAAVRDLADLIGRGSAGDPVAIIGRGADDYRIRDAVDADGSLVESRTSAVDRTARPAEAGSVPGLRPTDRRSSRRDAVIDALHRRYGRGGRSARFRYWRKKYAFLAAIASARWIKRFLDIVLSATLLLVLWPLLLAAAFLIKVSDGGPVLFRQVRIGRYGREFSFPKFRSMRMGSEAEGAGLRNQSHHADSRTFKMKRDPRVTRLGRVIRKLSIDELPQLWCVLKGDMSLVGPRPPLPGEVAQYSLADRRRLDVAPGLTGFWQVGGRGDVGFERQVELDVAYIESQSLWLDVKLLLRTVPAVILGRGAY
jgi:lipopolysaccharide/colanic/teichoic acid biosynthesis glycosyltransferase